MEKAKVKVNAYARYGLVGNQRVPFELAKLAFESAGHSVVDLGDGLLQYTMELDHDHPLVKEMLDGKEFSFSIRGANK